MKIYIVGPSCVGKTTLAREISRSRGWCHLDLDLLFWGTEVDNAGRLILSFKEKREYEEEIKKFLKNGEKNWVVEGVYCVREIMNEADLIIYIRLPFVLPLFRQWKRYLTDSFQRDHYGLKSNLMYLTPDIFKQYFSDRGSNNLEDPLIFSNKKTEKVLKTYKEKVKNVLNENELNKLAKWLKV